MNKNIENFGGDPSNITIAELTSSGAEVEEIHLNQQKIDLCRACGNGWGTCMSQGSCVIKDDLADILFMQLVLYL